MASFVPLARENYSLDGSSELMQMIDLAGQKAGYGRGQAFEDFLTAVTCTLATGLMEEEYLSMVRKGYDRGDPGKRGIDLFAQAFPRLIELMEDGRASLGDLFTGGITFGQGGQYFTPSSITDLLAHLLSDADDGEPKTVFDPCCGSGRMLLSYARQGRTKELIGQDIDLRCVKMTSINMALRGLYGYVLWGNSLAGEVKRGYRTGFNIHGTVIRPMREDECEYFRLQQHVSDPNQRDETDVFREVHAPPKPSDDAEPPKQQMLF